MKKIVDISVIEAYPKLRHDSINRESIIYVFNNEIFKILKESLRYIREKIIIESLNYNLSGIVSINDTLYDMNNQFFGYSMPKIAGSPLYSVLEKLTFEEKLAILDRLDEIYLNLFNSGFAYMDFHLGNIILSDGKPILLDRDGMIFKEDIAYGDMYWIINSFWSIVISLLYGYDLSLNSKSLDSLPLILQDKVYFDERFFERATFRRMLENLESKGERFYQASRSDVLNLVLKK